MNSRGKSKRSDDDNPYYDFQFRKTMIIIGMVVLSLVVALYSMMNGAYYISCLDVLDTLFFPNGINKVVIYDVRLPRVIAAILIGCALAVSGTVMQCVLKNPLASPYTLGISNAAAFGAAIGLSASYLGIFRDGFMHELLIGPYGMSLFAFIFSMIAVAVVLLLSRSTMGSPESMVLAGTALGSIFSAALASLQYFVDDQTLASIVYWQFGDLSKAYWNKLALLAAVLVPITAYFLYKRMDYNAMAAGEEVARSLGVKTFRMINIAMVLSSILAAVCIASVGIIGFVGLLGPHIMRRIIGNDHRFLLPASMVMGALVLLVADALGRLAFGSVVPVGILTSFLGGPLFLYILVKRRRRSSS